MLCEPFIFFINSRPINSWDTEMTSDFSQVHAAKWQSTTSSPGSLTLEPLLFNHYTTLTLHILILLQNTVEGAKKDVAHIYNGIILSCQKG